MQLANVSGAALYSRENVVTPSDGLRFGTNFGSSIFWFGWFGTYQVYRRRDRFPQGCWSRTRRQNTREQGTRKKGGGVLRQRNITMRGRSMLGDRPSVNTVHQVVDCSEQEKGQIHLPPPSPLPPCLTVGRIYVRKHPSLDAFRATICTYVLGRRTSWNWGIILSLVRLI